MQPGIKTLTKRKLIGRRLTTSLANNQPYKLQQSFIPRLKKIRNNLTAELFFNASILNHLTLPFLILRQHLKKWAAVEVK